MKIIIGKNTVEDFKILGKDGVDITEHFSVAGLKVDVKPHELTQVTMSMYVEEVQTEIEGEQLTIVIEDYQLAKKSLDIVLKQQRVHEERLEHLGREIRALTS